LNQLALLPSFCTLAAQSSGIRFGLIVFIGF
jgi:hypothetical protein